MPDAPLVPIRPLPPDAAPPPAGPDPVAAALARVRPAGAAWPPPDFTRALFRDGGVDLDFAAASARAAPAEACRWLAAVVADDELAVGTAVGAGLAPVHAADLLGVLGAGDDPSVTEAAVDTLVATFDRTGTYDGLFDVAIRALIAIGPPALEVVLAARVSTPVGSDAWWGLTQVIADLRVHDPRVREVLLDTLEAEPEFGLGCIAANGDPVLRPRILAMWEAFDATDAARDGDARGIGIELAGAVRGLGAPWGDRDEAKLDEIRRLPVRHPSDDDEFERAELAEDLRSILDDAVGFAPPPDDAPRRATAALDEAMDLERVDDDPSPPLERRATPGRNDPCWCGSGAKYKKCHLPVDGTEA